jgi:hypothetical protein
MKATISTLLAVSTLILGLAGLAAPIVAQEWNANDLPTGSTPWWQVMDREGRGGSGGN